MGGDHEAGDELGRLCYYCLMEDSIHFNQMLRERNIRREWIGRAERESQIMWRITKMERGIS